MARKVGAIFARPPRGTHHGYRCQPGLEHRAGAGGHPNGASPIHHARLLQRYAADRFRGGNDSRRARRNRQPADLSRCRQYDPHAASLQPGAHWPRSGQHHRRFLWRYSWCWSHHAYGGQHSHRRRDQDFRNVAQSVVTGRCGGAGAAGIKNPPCSARGDSRQSGLRHYRCLIPETCTPWPPLRLGPDGNGVEPHGICRSHHRCCRWGRCRRVGVCQTSGRCAAGRRRGREQGVSRWPI